MSEVRVAFTDTFSEIATFNNYRAGFTFFQDAANNPLTLLDVAGVDTGWGLNRTSTPAPGATSIGAGNNAGSGAAAWISAASNQFAHSVTAAPTWQVYNWVNLNNSLLYNFELYGISSSGDAVLEVQANGGAIVELSIVGNLTNTALITGLTPVSGVITFQVRRKTGLSSTGYISAGRLTSVAATDTTAPTFNTAPAVTATSETGHTIASTLNETGTLYGVRLASGATAPSPAQVKAGQNNTGAAALEAVSVAATAATNANLVFSTGAASTAYAYYIVAEDDETTPNLQAAPTPVSATTAATAVPGIGQLTVQFEGAPINVADWHIITRLVADQSILYNQTGQSSDASGNIAAFATTSGNVGDPVRVEGLSAADAYSFVIEQNLGNIA
jgi:hypothetical protein